MICISQKCCTYSIFASGAHREFGSKQSFLGGRSTTGVEGGGKGRLSWVTCPPGGGWGGAVLCGTLELRCPVPTGAALGPA